MGTRASCVNLAVLCRALGACRRKGPPLSSGSLWERRPGGRRVLSPGLYLDGWGASRREVQVARSCAWSHCLNFRADLAGA